MTSHAQSVVLAQECVAKYAKWGVDVDYVEIPSTDEEDAIYQGTIVCRQMQRSHGVRIYALSQTSLGKGGSPSANSPDEAVLAV